MIQNLTDRNFDSYIQDGDRIVICTAGYCGACVNAIKNVTVDYGLLVLTDPLSRRAMMKTKCKKVPTIIWYRDGKEVNRAEGTTALLNLHKTGQA